VRRHVEELYRASNQSTARMLAERGYGDLPEWLMVSSAA
jgi:hypothetical protein